MKIARGIEPAKASGSVHKGSGMARDGGLML